MQTWHNLSKEITLARNVKRENKGNIHKMRIDNFTTNVNFYILEKSWENLTPKRSHQNWIVEESYTFSCDMS